LAKELKKKISETTKKAMARPEVRDRYLEGLKRRELNRHKNEESTHE
jgi:hypothetical protein